MEPKPTEPLAPRTLLWRAVVGLFILFSTVAAAGLLARGPIEAGGAWFVSHMGLLGVFISVTVVDTLPLTHEPILFLAWSGGLGFWPVWASASAGSVTAGGIGWALGGLLSGQGWMQRALIRYRVDQLFQRYGVWAVAVAALTPFPYAVATWAAGAARMPLGPVVLGSCVRILKVWIYLSLMVAGWTATS
jgi:membrane protein YqaA with SNARE-associated domain